MSKNVRANKGRRNGLIVFLIIMIIVMVFALGFMILKLFDVQLSDLRLPAIRLSEIKGQVSNADEPGASPSVSLIPIASMLPTTEPHETHPEPKTALDQTNVSLNETKQPQEQQTPAPTEAPVVLPDFASDHYDAYFDDVVFVGDSVTQGLQYYVMYRQGQGEATLGKARFLAAASYNLATAGKPFNPNKINVSYQGTTMSIEDALDAMDAKHMFIMLGLNDWAGSAVNANISLYRAMLTRVMERMPQLRITVQSCTPVTPEGEKPKLTSAGMDAFNEALKQLCVEMGVEYLDVGTPLKNSEGKLNPEYSSDNYVHLNNSGLRIWVDTLRSYVLWHEAISLETQGTACVVPSDAPARESVFFMDPELPETVPEVFQMSEREDQTVSVETSAPEQEIEPVG